MKVEDVENLAIGIFQTPVSPMGGGKWVHDALMPAMWYLANEDLRNSDSHASRRLAAIVSQSPYAMSLDLSSTITYRRDDHTKSNTLQ